MTAEPVKTVEDLNTNIPEIITEKPNYGSANQCLIDYLFKYLTVRVDEGRIQD